MPTEFELTFTGSTKNLLAALAVLAEHEVNLNTIDTRKVGDNFIVKFITGSEEEVRHSFMKADLRFKDRRVLVVEMHNKPGQWLKVADGLVGAGVEIEASYMLSQKGDKQSFVFAVSDYQKARAICGKLGECSID